MAIINTITDASAFYYALQKTDGYKNNFSYDGAKTLQAYLDDYSDEIGENIEFDPIGWCCEFSEYDDLADYNSQHGTEWATWDELSYETTVITIDGSDGAIVQGY